MEIQLIFISCIIQARLHVSEAVLEQITLLNSLDVELYKRGQKIFGRQRQVMDKKLRDSATPVSFHFFSTDIFSK